jgi:hypothetical protein
MGRKRKQQFALTYGRGPRQPRSHKGYPSEKAKAKKLQHYLDKIQSKRLAWIHSHRGALCVLGFCNPSDRGVYLISLTSYQKNNSIPECLCTLQKGQESRI